MRHLAYIRAALGVAALIATACSDNSADEAFSGGLPGEDYGSAGAGGSSGGADPDEPGTSAGGGTTGGADDGYGETEGEVGSTGGESGGDMPPPDAGPFATCPLDLPEGWIFCEDFEAADAPGVFFDYVDSEGDFVPTFDGGAASGIGAMRAHYREGEEGAGFMSVSFGANPINTNGRPVHAVDENFDEIYWRFRVKMQEGWPEAGPYNLTRINAFAESDWGQAMVASVGSKGDDVMLEAAAASCVQQGQVVCKGIDDMDAMQPLGSLVGQTPVFSAERAGTWQCIEAHVRLNAPGETDGIFELWVDGNLEGSSEGIDWRGSWTEFGLNLVSIENFWVGGAPADLDRWFDDLVISTQPIGCD